jgi:hypothetical protein
VAGRFFPKLLGTIIGAYSSQSGCLGLFERRYEGRYEGRFEGRFLNFELLLPVAVIFKPAFPSSITRLVRALYQPCRSHILATGCPITFGSVRIGQCSGIKVSI